MLRRCLVLLLVLAGLLATVGRPLAQEGGDVPMERGNAARTGEMPGPGPDPSNGVQERWQFPPDDGLPYSFYSVVADGLVYAGTGDKRTGDLTLYALDAATGAERWRTGGPGVSLAVVDGVVYAQGDAEDGDLYYALDSATGTERWRVATDVDLEGSPPVVADGIVYVTSYDTVLALDAGTGAERWRFATDGDVDSPAVVDDVVYIASGDIVFALDAGMGTERWRFTTDGDADSPAVADGVVYIGSDNGILALDAMTGTERWRFATDDDYVASPAVAGGLVYAVNAQDNVYALDASSGIERWRVATDFGYEGSPLAVADGIVYLGGDDIVLALDAVTGSERWRWDIIASDDSYTPAAVVDGRVYVVSENGYIYALDAAQPVLESGAAAEIAEGGADLRGGPTETAVVRMELDAGIKLTITGEAEVTADGVEWWPVTVTDTGEVGWVKGEDLVAVFPDE